MLFNYCLPCRPTCRYYSGSCSTAREWPNRVHSSTWLRMSISCSMPPVGCLRSHRTSLSTSTTTARGAHPIGPCYLCHPKLCVCYEFFYVYFILVKRRNVLVLSYFVFCCSRKENSFELSQDSLNPAKRHQPMSPRVSPNGVLNLNSGPIKLEDISLSRELRERERAERDRADRERTERGGDRHFPAFNNSQFTQPTLQSLYSCIE